MPRRFAASALITATLIAFSPAAIAQSNRAASASVAERVAKLRQAVADAGRTPANAARDRYRHPVETLDFFEVDPGDTVVEIWPGGGWYTEILTPYLTKGGGKLVLAAPAWGRSGVDKLRTAYATL